MRQVDIWKDKMVIIQGKNALSFESCICNPFLEDFI